MLAHFAGDVAEDLAAGASLVEAELEHRVRERGGDGGFDFDRFGFGQKYYSKSWLVIVT